VLVGETAASGHAEHRFSRDADHVLTDLRHRFDEVLSLLELVAGWIFLVTSGSVVQPPFTFDFFTDDFGIRIY